MSEQLDLRPSQTSSIGAVWPPEKTTHSRLRGFYADGVVRTPADTRRFAADFDAQRIVAQTLEGVDRLTVRVVAHAGALATLENMGVSVEAALPLAGAEPDLVVAYTAANHASRAMSAEHLADWQSRLQQAAARPRDTKDRATELRAQGFAPHFVDRTQASALTPRFLDLYAAFGYNEQQVTELLENPDNTIAYIADGDRVVSTAMAETGTVAVAGLPLTLVEITEASTHPDYQGRGLYKAVSGYLTERLLQERGGEMNALYGESNLAMRGVLYAAHENGRQFSHFDEYGLANPAFGILQQNFHVSDGAETRPYNDFALSYVPLS